MSRQGQPSIVVATLVLALCSSAQAAIPPSDSLDEPLQMVRAGRFEAARARLAPIVVQHPRWGRAHLLLGLTFHKQHRYEEARESFERALVLQPDHQPTRLYLGWALYYLGELAASRAVFESVLRGGPVHLDAIFALGLIDFDEDATDRALERFTLVIGLARESGDETTEAKARARLADVWMRRDEWARARDELQRSAALQSGNHETFFKLSRVLLWLGDADGAAEALTRYERLLDARARGGPGTEP